MSNLARALQHSVAAAVEFIGEYRRDIVCACESERRANAQALAMLEDAAMFTVAFAAANHDRAALAVAAQEFKFWAQDAASWAQELLEVLKVTKNT